MLAQVCDRCSLQRRMAGQQGCGLALQGLRGTTIIGVRCKVASLSLMQNYWSCVVNGRPTWVASSCSGGLAP